MQHARRCFDLSENLGGGANRVLAGTALGLAFTVEADYPNAISTLGKAASLIDDLNTFKVYKPQVLTLLAEAQAASGDHEKARQHAEEAIRLTESDGVGGYAADARLALARICLESDPARLSDKASACLDSAEQLVETYGIESFRPRILELRAIDARRMGDGEKFIRLTTDARSLYREMGASGHERRLADLLSSET